MKMSNKLAVGVAAMTVSGMALATPGTFDTSGAVTTIAAISVGIAAIGAAKMAPAAIAVGWKWLKATVFG